MAPLDSLQVRKSWSTKPPLIALTQYTPVVRLISYQPHDDGQFERRELADLLRFASFLTS